jgi:predicted dehydrogenase
MAIQAVVIGAGQVAQQHLACLSSLSNVKLTGVCDLSRAVAECAADRFGVKAWFTDHTRMLAELQPDVVHITTPPSSHFRLAQDCLNAGTHVFVEKPATTNFGEFTALQALAKAKEKLFIEDYNYLFNDPVRRLIDWVDQGVLGNIVNVEVTLCLNILEKDNPFVDLNLRHPALDLCGGAISDFLPHLASLAYSFCGSINSARTTWDKRTQSSPLPCDEFRAVLHGNRSTGILVFSAHSQPDVFQVTVHGTLGRATANIFENRLTCSQMRQGFKPLIPLFNALDEAKILRRSAWGLLWNKLSGGPGAYEGLWTLSRQVYESISSGTPPPISPTEMLEVNRLIQALTNEENKF